MMNGDVITTLDYGELVRAHERSGNALTIATQVRTATIDFGVLQLADAAATATARRRPSWATSRSRHRDYASRWACTCSSRRCSAWSRTAPIWISPTSCSRACRGRAGRLVPLRRTVARHRATRGLRAGDRRVLGDGRLARRLTGRTPGHPKRSPARDNPPLIGVEFRPLPPAIPGIGWTNTPKEICGNPR